MQAVRHRMATMICKAMIVQAKGVISAIFTKTLSWLVVTNSIKYLLWVCLGVSLHYLSFGCNKRKLWRLKKLIQRNICSYYRPTFNKSLIKVKQNEKILHNKYTIDFLYSYVYVKNIESMSIVFSTMRQTLHEWRHEYYTE